MPRKPALPKEAKMPPAAPVQVEPRPEEPSPTVTNCRPGTTLSLGDGRSLGFGESAEVAEELAAFLRKRGQVE